MNKENVSIMRKNAFMRIVMLTSNCITSLSGSIFAIYTRELARTTAIGDPNFLTSINQTISSFGMLLGVSLAAYIFKKVGGLRQYFTCSSILFMVVSFLQFAFKNYYLFTFFGIFFSFSIGLFSLTATFYALGFADENKRYQAQANLNSSIQAGQGLAIIIGGIIATQLEFRYVYLLMSVLVVFLLILGRKLESVETVVDTASGNLFKIFTNKRALIHLLFLAIPTGAIQVFITYKLPLDIVDLGFSTMMVSFLLLIKRFIGVYTQPFTTKFLNKHFSRIKIGLIYLFATIVVLSIYGTQSGFFVVLVTVLLLGVFDSFGLTALSNSFYATRKDDSYTDKDSSVVYNISTSIGRMIGPNLISLTGTVLCLPIVASTGLGVYLLCNLFLIKETK